jgi:SAM-dependent methyltransferase
VRGFFDVAYEGRPTWDIGRPQGAVVRLAEGGRVAGSVLDVGCGTGEHALYLAGRGHEVLGIDLAPRAIDRARAKARERGLPVTFLVWDALRAHELGRVFDTALDVGLFHSLPEGDRMPYARALHAALAPGGRAFVLCWSDRNPWGFGPRRISRRELRETFAGVFEIEAIVEEALESLLPDGPVRAWLADLRRS